jgi:hypothetical protein
MMAVIDYLDPEVVRGIVANWWPALVLSGGVVYMTTKVI